MKATLQGYLFKIQIPETVSSPLTEQELVVWAPGNHIFNKLHMKFSKLNLRIIDERECIQGTGSLCNEATTVSLSIAFSLLLLPIPSHQSPFQFVLFTVARVNHL